MNERKIKIIKRDEKEVKRKRVEVGLMEIYLEEMIVKYPENFKNLMEKIRRETQSIKTIDNNAHLS
jgi:hypothetical protein